jgi:Protein of unknown function (DUF2752)
MNSVPPKISTPNARVAAIVLAAMAAGVAAVVFFFNPASHGFYPVCEFHRLTGLNCPGCGGTRALYALLHGRWAVALRDNALLVGGLVFLGVRGGWFAARKFCGRANGEFIPAKFLWLLLVIMVVFTVLRNLPALAFLSP